MYSDDPGRMAATCDCVAVQASLETGKSVLLTKALRSAATRHPQQPRQQRISLKRV
jgi:acyl-CoA thioesterase FadM